MGPTAPDTRATRFDLVADLFDEALARPLPERAAWLRERVAGDAALHDEVASLLAAHERSGGVLDAPDVVAMLDRADGALVGRRIGPWRLTRELGRGGMGVVFLAERADGEFERRVALKLLRASADGEELRRRLVVERRILASLEHPNIARLLDGGVTEERLPYLVIEHVDGRPITRWCDDERLDVAARVTLFLGVCAAVHHAHQALVLHRDLKPANVLVTAPGPSNAGPGVPKLLDFGIAKLLGPGPSGVDAALTRTSHRLMTPAYASPEQVRGDTLTTASDVYGLGLLLYELLVGHPAQRVRSDAPSAVLEAVCEREPARPSDRVLREDDGDAERGRSPQSIAGARGTTPERLSRQLRGDLDAIVLTALRKEPGRRYGSAATLADDLQRWLDAKPVRARRGSTAYRARKLLRRHRVAALAGAAVLVAVVGGLSASLWQAGIASRERDRATAALARTQVALRQSEEVGAFLVDLFEPVDPSEGRTDSLSARDLLRRGEARAGRLRDEPIVQARMLDALGRGYASLGDPAQGATVMRRALALRRRELGERSVETAATMASLAGLLQQRGDYAAADSLAYRAWQVRRELLGDAHADVAASLHQLAQITVYRERPDLAERYARLALEGRRRAGAPDDSLSARVLETLARLRWRAGDFAGSERLLREGLTAATRVLPAPYPLVATLRARLADQLAERSDGWPEAERHYRAALAETRAALGPSHPRTLDALRDVGYALATHGLHDEGEGMLREALAVGLRLHGPRHPSVAYSMSGLAQALAARGRVADAERAMRDAVTVFAAVWGERHSNYAGALDRWARLLARRGALDSAETVARRAVAIRVATFGPGARIVGVTELCLANVLHRRGRLAAAESVYVHARDVIRRYTSDAHVDVRQAHEGLAGVYASWGRTRDAERVRRLARAR